MMSLADARPQYMQLTPMKSLVRQEDTTPLQRLSGKSPVRKPNELLKVPTATTTFILTQKGCM